MKIGLFFGSFNPIHMGHLIIAQTALNETDLERVWFVVSPQNPFKKMSTLLSEADRFNMVDDAIKDHPNLMVSNVEFSLPKPSYTIDTLTVLREQFPTYDFNLLMGEDNLQHFHKWKNYEAILKYYPIYCYPRLGSDGSNFEKYPTVHRFELPFLDISATRIRKYVKEGKSIRFMVPDVVREYITSNHFYEY